MKREFLKRRRALLGRGVGPAGFALLGVLVFFIVLRLLVPGFFITIASPFWNAGTVLAAKTEGFFGVFHDRAALVAERDSAIASATAARAQLAQALEKASDLERLLGSRTEAPPGILAGVIARPPESAYDTLVVDQGASSGVMPSAVAYGPGGVPVGTVASVSNSAARIALYSAPRRITDAWLGAARTPIRLVGEGGGAFYAEAPGTASTTAGDAVSVSGPGALPIGTVARVESDPSSPTAVIRITPLINPFSLTWVTIARAISAP